MRQEKYLESKKISILFFLFMFLLYAVVYMTKNMFTSAMAIIVEAGVMTKSETGLISAVFWFVYAPFQVIGGFAADKYSPYKLILLGLLGTTAANMVIYFNQNYYVMLIAWGFSAAIQFGLWPSIFKVISTNLALSVRGEAVFWMMFSPSVGLGLSMLIASFVKEWEYNFLVSAISLAVCFIIYFFVNKFMEGKMSIKEVPLENKEEGDKAKVMPLILKSGLIAFLALALFRYAIDNGIKVMTPTMLMESYENLPGAIATRISSVLVIFSAVGTMTAGFMRDRITKNELKAQMIYYAASLIPIGIACFVGKINYWYILASLSVAIIFLQGSSPFSQSFVALRFGKYGRIGTMSGILNATASVGNILATYVFAKMAEIMPWDLVVISWLVTIIICFILCISTLKRWSRFVEE